MPTLILQLLDCAIKMWSACQCQLADPRPL